MKITYILRYVLLTFFIAACGGGGSDDDDDTDSGVTDIEKTVINSFVVTGSGTASNGTIPISAAIADGAFTIDWDIESTDIYNFRLFISDNDTYDENDDIEIFVLSCGPEDAVFNCDQRGNFDCRFNSSNEMSCGVIAPGNSAKDLTAFLPSLPQDAFLIAHACNSLAEDCEIEPVSILLQ